MTRRKEAIPSPESAGTPFVLESPEEIAVVMHALLGHVDSSGTSAADAEHHAQQLYDKEEPERAATLAEGIAHHRQEERTARLLAMRLSKLL